MSPIIDAGLPDAGSPGDALPSDGPDHADAQGVNRDSLARAVGHAVERSHMRAEVQASEARYRGLFEHAGDAVLMADDAGRFVDANPAACELLGISREEAIGRSLSDFVDASAGMPDAAEAWAAFLAAREMRGHVRIRRPDGTVRDAGFLARADVTPGRHLSVLRDETERIAAQAALTASEARFRLALDDLGLHAMVLDTQGRMLFVNRYHLARTGWTDADLIGADAFIWLDPHDGPDARRGVFLAGIRSSAIVDKAENSWRTRSGDSIRIAWTNSAIRDEAGRIVALASVGEDVTARRQAEEMQARLVSAVEQTAETIVVTDDAARVVYANPAFEQSSGYATSHVMGKDLWAFLRSSGSRCAHQRIARRLRTGRSWSGEWTLRRRDGTAYHQEVTISPVRDERGSIASFVSVARDVTQLRQVQSSLAVTARERVAFAHVLSRLQPRETPEEAAQDITDAAGALPGIDVAALVYFGASGDAQVLAVTAPGGYPLSTGQILPASRSAYLQGRAAHGPWAERWEQRDVDGGYGTAISAVGLRAVAYAPVDHGDGPIALIALGTLDEQVAERMAEQIPAALDFAAAASSVIAGPLAARRRLLVGRGRIEKMIAAGDFDPVFQPIVDLRTRVAVGYEGLTRFRDGTSPELVFAEASHVGVGLELEAATLDRVMAAARDLPAGPWLSVNVSAALILERDRLTAILSRGTRPIVLEVTEYDAIGDYVAVRDELARLEPGVRVAVDDAGAGVANFKHIVELRPHFLKVDGSLVRAVDEDIGRQALIAGFHHFAKKADACVVAEGVETEAECQALVALEVTFGQGHLFGRPAHARSWPAPAGLLPTGRPWSSTLPDTHRYGAGVGWRTAPGGPDAR